MFIYDTHTHVYMYMPHIAKYFYFLKYKLEKSRENRLKEKQGMARYREERKDSGGVRSVGKNCQL